MELEHDFTVPASVEETWAAFNDPAQVAPCFPGATLLSAEGDTFTGSAKIKLGPIALQYNGVGTYVERDQSAHRAVIEARGKDKRGNGTASATVTAQMSPDAQGTAVHVTTDLAVTGKPAQFGRGVIQDVSDKLLGQFVACLKTTLGTPEAEQSSAVDPQPGPVENQAGPVEEVTDPGTQASPVVTAPDGTTTFEAGPQTPVPAYTRAEPAYTPAEPASTPVESASTPAKSATASTASTASTVSTTFTAPEADVEINLLSTVGRVLLTRFAARALGPVALGAGLALGYLLGRRARR